MRHGAGILPADGEARWIAVCLAATAIMAFAAGYDYAASTLCSYQAAVIIEVEEANYIFPGRTVIELADGRRLAQAGIYGAPGQKLRVRPQMRGGWK